MNENERSEEQAILETEMINAAIELRDEFDYGKRELIALLADSI